MWTKCRRKAAREKEIQDSIASIEQLRQDSIALAEEQARIAAELEQARQDSIAAAEAEAANKKTTTKKTTTKTETKTETAPEKKEGVSKKGTESGTSEPGKVGKKGVN